MEYHDDSIFPLLWHLAPPLQVRTTMSSSIRRRAGSPLRVILNSSTETPFGPTAFPFAKERIVSLRIHTYETARQSEASRARVPEPSLPIEKSRASPLAPPSPLPLSGNEVPGTLSLGVPHPFTVCADRPRARLVRVVTRPTRRTEVKTYVPTRWGVGSRHLCCLLCAVLILPLPHLVRCSRTPCRRAKLLLSRSQPRISNRGLRNVSTRRGYRWTPRRCAGWPAWVQSGSIMSRSHLRE